MAPGPGDGVGQISAEGGGRKWLLAGRSGQVGRGACAAFHTGTASGVVLSRRPRRRLDGGCLDGCSLGELGEGKLEGADVNG